MISKMNEWGQEMGPSVLLIVDDDAALRESLIHALKREGHRVHAASDGLAGVRMARTVRPQLILLDIVLPDIDGIEVGRRIRAERPVEHPAILAMTGCSTPQLSSRIREAGFFGPLLKPFRLHDLSCQIGKLVSAGSSFPL